MNTNDNLIRVNVWPGACAIDQKDMWIAHGVYNMLFKYDIERESAEWMCSLTDEKLLNINAVNSVVFVNGLVYTIPFKGNHIHCYGCSKKQENIVPFPDEEEYRGRLIFRNAYYFDGRIICIPSNYHSIISIDPTDNSVYKEFDLLKELTAQGINKVSINDTCMDDNGIIYAVISNSNKILSYDIKMQKCDIKQIGDDQIQYVTVAIADNKLYLNSVTYKALFIYDTNVGEIVKKIDIPFENFRIMKIQKGSILIDSMNDGKHIIFDGNQLKFFESQKNDIVPSNAYKYTYGVPINDDFGHNFYYDRYSYELKSIDDKRDMSNKGKKIISMVREGDIKFPDYEIVQETEELDLQWMLKKVINHDYNE